MVAVSDLWPLTLPISESDWWIDEYFLFRKGALHSRRKRGRVESFLTNCVQSGIVSYMANLDRVFHSLADGTRRAVIARLARGPASVGDLAQRHRMALPSFMKHLRVLEGSKIVVSHKKGRVRMCELRLEALASAQTWIEKERQLWTTRLNQFDALVVNIAEREKTDGH